MYETIENAVGDGRVADLFVPFGDGDLRSQDRRVDLIAFLADFPEVPTLGFLQRSHGPVIDDE